MSDRRKHRAEDDDLLRRVSSGDRRAFDEFVRLHQASVLRFVVALGRSRPDAEDTLQETFLIAWRKAGQYRGEGSARSWLFTIARRLVHRAAVRGKPSEKDTLSLEELGERAGWGRRNEAPNVAGRVEDVTMVRQALQRLGPDERAALVLRDLEGLSSKEAAEVLGLGVAALKSRVHRARLRLASLLRVGVSDER